MRSDDFIMMPIPSNMFTSVCALLGGAALSALSTGNTGSVSTVASGADAPAAVRSTAPEPQGTASVADGTNNADSSQPVADGEVDRDGHPWSPDLHASTKTQTKEGLWRMKIGVSRPAPLPGFPKDGASTGTTGTQNSGTGSQAGAPATGGNAGPATSGEDEDEFAAFRAAADKAGATDAAAAAGVSTVRKWTDGDLGALCNQAAVKLGAPDAVKAVIAQFVPEGQVPHSRNVPEANREAFAQAVEKVAGITFAA
jgi:hypothetical protein